MATAVSKITIKVKANKISLNKGKLVIAPAPLIKANNKWPATMLAANRTERVIGRIKFLIVSIRTIKGIKTLGVPRGTRCLRKKFKSLIKIVITAVIQSTNAKLRVNTKCLEGVKM